MFEIRMLFFVDRGTQFPLKTPPTVWAKKGHVLLIGEK